MEDTGLKLSDKEIAAAFSSSGWAEKYPPVLTLEQASQLLSIPKETLYGWRSRGRLTGCCRKVGKHLRFFRDRLIKHVFNESN
jgi:excisionase family DNA binding protein